MRIFWHWISFYGMLLVGLLALSGPLKGQTYDLIIYGGTPAGVTASIQGAELGHRVYC